MRNAIDVAHDLSQIAEPFLDAGARSRVDKFLDMGEGRIAVETILRAAVAFWSAPAPSRAGRTFARWSTPHCDTTEESQPIES
jgi:hypothetical protein